MIKPSLGCIAGLYLTKNQKIKTISKKKKKKKKQVKPTRSISFFQNLDKLNTTLSSLIRERSKIQHFKGNIITTTEKI
jgi:hypothetical protein